MEVLYGLHPVSEALKAGRRRFDHVLVARERHDDRLDRVIAQCRDAGIRVREESREQLTLAANTPAHQGVVALVRPQEFLTIEDLFAPDPATNKSPAGKSAARLVLAIDGVEDPQNLGALLRVADGAGVDGVLLTERRSAPLSPAAVKASAGAAEHVRIARVVNLVRSLEELKRHNLWIVGLDAGGLDAGVAERGQTAGPTLRGPAAGPTPYDQFDFTGDLVIVLGSEGAGLHDLVRRTCDHLLHIPMAGGVSSLNVSAAGAVVLFEAARQRRAAGNSKSGTANALTTQPTASKPKKQKGLGS
jgi:23S rRNA (guanosine2251-2'-O)-methyltransferase